MVIGMVMRDDGHGGGDGNETESDGDANDNYPCVANNTDTNIRDVIGAVAAYVATVDGAVLIL